MIICHISFINFYFGERKIFFLTILKAFKLSYFVLIPMFRYNFLHVKLNMDNIHDQCLQLSE